MFSSIGPTLDGRIKPDIVAPGTTISVFAAQCAPVRGLAGRLGGCSCLSCIAIGKLLKHKVRRWYLIGLVKEVGNGTK